MSDAQIQGYARALFEIARADGTLDEVEDELFRFARSYESSEELRNTLSDDQILAEKRQAIIEDLLGGKATPTTSQLVSMVVGSGRARDLPAIVDVLVDRASDAKQLAVAEVRTAVPLTGDQQDRLKAALENATGNEPQPQGDRRPHGSGRRRRHHRRRRDRRLRPHPYRPAEEPALSRARDNHHG